MKTAARLIATSVPDAPEGAVLVLHGGASRGSQMMVSPTQLSVLRMIPIAGRIARAGKDRLAVFRVLNSVRGWDTSHTPVDDARWALDRVAERLGDLPTFLVGHSLGGRAALLAAATPGVRGAVALAPWVYPTDLADGLPPGRRVLIVHGSGDRIAKPANSAAVAEALGRTTPTGYVRVEGGKHAMLSHHDQFSGLAAAFTTEVLLGTTPEGALARIAAGERFVEV